MLVKSIAALAALTFAANVAAEPMPYQPSMMKTSVRDLFGIVRRQDDSGYQPEQTVCGSGNTCAEACGAGYETCVSKDSAVHCFNPIAGEICCPDLSGSSCDKGYYCTADSKGETWCCPNGMDTAACAAAYSMTGGLVSQTPPPATSTSTSSSTSTTQPPTTTTSSSSSLSSSSTSSTESSTSKPSFLPSSSIVQTNTTSISTVKPPKPTQTKVDEGAGSVVGPATAFVFLAAGFAALL